MYHSETDTPAVARNSNLNEELGQVCYYLICMLHVCVKQVRISVLKHLVWSCVTIHRCNTYSLIRPAL